MGSQKIGQDYMAKYGVKPGFKPRVSSPNHGAYGKGGGILVSPGGAQLDQSDANT